MIAATACAVLAVGACSPSGDGKPTELPPSSQSSGTSTSPKLTAEQEAIVNQYKAYFENFVQLVGEPKQVVFEVLTKYAYPQVVEIAYQGLQALDENGKRAGGTITYGQLEPTVTGKTASLIECRDSSTETVVSAIDGTVLTHGSPGTRFISSFELNDDGRWRITDLTGKESAC